VTILRLEALVGASVDRAIAAVETATLMRRPDGAFMEVPDAQIGLVLRGLAFAGVRAEMGEVDLAVSRALLPAVGRDLSPLAKGLVACDVVRVRRLTLGQATRELLRRPALGLGRPGEPARTSARALLRCEDALLAWARQAWATRDALRTRAVRRSLRPVIFDREALTRADLRGRTLASAGALTRWLFA
jgi:hypothetical protein